MERLTMAELEKGLEVVKSVLPKMRVALREFRKVTRKLQSLVPQHSRAGAANCLLFAHMHTLRAVMRLLADGLYGDAFTYGCSQCHNRVENRALVILGLVAS